MGVGVGEEILTNGSILLAIKIGSLALSIMTLTSLSIMKVSTITKLRHTL